MKTAKGSTFTTLLDVAIDAGFMVTQFKVPMTLGTISHDDIAKMIPHINERIITEKKPGATYEKCLEQIELHRDHLVKAYIKLFETYKYATNTATRLTPANKAAMAMLAAMPDKMLRDYARLYIGDAVNEYILPDDRDTLIVAVIEAINKVERGNGADATVNSADQTTHSATLMV